MPKMTIEQVFRYFREDLPGIEEVKQPGGRPSEWHYGNEVYSSKGKANRAKLGHMVDLAIEVMEGGLELIHANPHIFPAAAGPIIETRWRKAKGIPRKKWKWSPEARARRAEAMKGVTPPPRKRGYPLLELSPDGELEIPEAGHRFTLTRATLEEIRDRLRMP